jgi:hypothetical protein
MCYGKRGTHPSSSENCSNEKRSSAAIGNRTQVAQRVRWILSRKVIVCACVVWMVDCVWNGHIPGAYRQESSCSSWNYQQMCIEDTNTRVSMTSNIPDTRACGLERSRHTCRYGFKHSRHTCEYDLKLFRHVWVLPQTFPTHVWVWSQTFSTHVLDLKHSDTRVRMVSNIPAGTSDSAFPRINFANLCTFNFWLEPTYINYKLQLFIYYSYWTISVRFVSILLFSVLNFHITLHMASEDISVCRRNRSTTDQTFYILQILEKKTGVQWDSTSGASIHRF